MSRWFRSYADTHRNPKVAGLSDADFRLWHLLLCIAAENEGVIPPLEALKRLLKRRLDHLKAALDRLVKEGLIDPCGDGFAPHNWLERQYKSDCSTDRVKRFRNGGGNVSETAPDTEADTDTDTEKKKVTPPKGGHPYVFEGQVIRLFKQQFQAWEKAYPDIDLRASLQSRDDWLATEADEKTRKRWFMSTSNHLANLQSKASAVDRSPVWDGMP